MKYTPLHYAKAFAAALAEHPKSGEKFAANFARLIERNGDARHAPKILAATEKLVRAASGAKKVTLVTARPPEQSLRTAFRKLIGAHDTVEEKVDPSLIGGVKIVVNEEEQFDGSLKRKMDKLFDYTRCEYTNSC
ncbi:MAG: F0F1 ATP synthase subunit delta [Candidatus Liptonbacteria bacterium]|nr:F0F1 ATP synthase subunit delta [Candidatus Liptonbacteria bacterium]MBI3114660.1 F0F1 ATP synthase subunit delta [Candidatus Harrisonbacteria bacterium]